MLFSISENTDFLFDKEIYIKFENNCIGNTNNNLLSFGNYARKKNITCKLDNFYFFHENYSVRNKF